MEKIDIIEVKRLEVEILDYVVKLCNNMNLKYCLAYGTLLGAIRHKGFIPWDDDIDICMPREDYNILLEYLQKSKDSKFKVLVPHVGNYYYPFLKVINVQTVIPIRNIEETHELGVWIDIFPLDGMPKHKNIYKYLMNTISHLRHLAVFKELPSLGFKEKIIIWPCWKFARLLGLFNLLRWTEILATKTSFNSSDKVAVQIEPDSNGIFFDKKMFEQLTQVEFEKNKYYAPKDYDLYLRLMYGDYMKFPPLEQRISHGIVAYLK